MRAAWMTTIVAAVATAASVMTVKAQSETVSANARVGNGWHMTTSVTLDGSGGVYGTTTLKNHNNVLGFTGGVFLVFLDENNAPVYNTELRTYGINACFFKSNVSRTERWSDRIPADVLSKVASVSIIQDHAPTYRVVKWIWENRNTIIAHASYIKQLYADIKGGNFGVDDAMELAEQHLGRL